MVLNALKRQVCVAEPIMYSHVWRPQRGCPNGCIGTSVGPATDNRVGLHSLSMLVELVDKTIVPDSESPGPVC